jgi:membrane-associated phospholipid phosphatase
VRADQVGLALAGWAIVVSRGRLRTVGTFIAPILIMAAVYDAQRYWAEAWRSRVHVVEPYQLELAWFGIRGGSGVITPAAWCQTHTHALLDAVAGMAYLLFIPMFVGLAAWWRFRERRPAAQDMMWAVLWLNLAGYAAQLLYAAAPPWYVAHYGLGPADLAAPPESGGAARFDALFHVSWFASWYAKNTNVFGAMPSLHVGQSFLATLYAWQFGSRRTVATVFWAVVAFSSVYLNHHYVVDGLAGMAFAVAAWGSMFLWRRLGSRR